MSNGVRLWGGPWHGKVISVEKGQTCVKVAIPDPLVKPSFTEPSEYGSDTMIPQRIAHYSSVAGHRETDFEWDGFVD